MNRRLIILIFVLSFAFIPLGFVGAQEGPPSGGGGGAGENGGQPIPDLSDIGPVSGSDANGHNNGAGGTNSGGSQSIETDEFTGATTHNITIPVPPSRGGIEPQLVINYHSHRRNPNSWVGYGWELDLGQIIRLPQKTTLAEVEGDRDDQDGDPVNNVIDPIGGTSFEARFAGQSETLVYIPKDVNLADYGLRLGNDIKADLYQSKAQSSFNVYLHLRSTLRPEQGIDVTDRGWIVFDKTGKRYEFGRSQRTRDEKMGSYFESEDSRFGVDRWLLEKVIDPNGNELTVTYGDDLLLDRVTYNDIVIEFQKSDRSKYFPIFKESFLAPSQISRQLDAITISQGNQRLQKFVLRYKSFQNGTYQFIDEIPEDEFKPGYTYLGSVQQLGRENDVSLPATSFDYYLQPESDETKMRFGAKVLTGGASFLWKKNQFADMNGNGFVDFVFMTGPNTMAVSADIYERGFTNQGPAALPWALPPDFCKDDKKGLLNWCQENLIDSSNDGSIVYQRLFLMDMNGDTLPDRVRTHHKETDPGKYKKGFYVTYNTGSGWQQDPVFWEDPVAEYNSKAAGTITGSAGLVDMNGDGLADRVFQSKNKKGFTVCLNQGYQFQALENCRYWADPVNVTGSFAEEQQESAVGQVYYFKNGDQRAFVRDFNGDGLPDRIWKAKFYEFGREFIDRGGFHRVKPDHIGSGYMVALNRNGEGWASPSQCPLPPEEADIVVRPAPRPDENVPQPNDFECEPFQHFNNIDVLALKGPEALEGDPQFFDKKIGKEADFMDMNGDGYLDWVQRAKVNDVLGFNVSFYKGSVTGVENDDGDIDFEFVQYSPFIFIADPINHGRGEDDGRGYIFKGISGAKDYSIHTSFHDVNGDGYPDRVSLEPARFGNDDENINYKFEMYPLELNAVQFTENRNRRASQPMGRLKSVNNGYGNQTGVEYYPSTWPYKNAGPGFHRFMPLNLFVAHKIYTKDYTLPHENRPANNRWPNFREVTYFYKGGNFFVRYGTSDETHPYFAQFNGFQQVSKEIKPGEGEDWDPYLIITYYHQGLGEAPLAGRPFFADRIDDAEDQQRDKHFSLSGKSYKQVTSEQLREGGVGFKSVSKQKWVIANRVNNDEQFQCAGDSCIVQLRQTSKQVKEAGQELTRSGSISYEYDPLTNNILRQINRDAQGNEILVTETTYFPQGNFAQNPLIRDHPETQSQLKNGVAYRSKKFGYDNRGNPTSEDFLVNPGQWISIKRNFDRNGNMTSITDVDGITKQLVYDNNGLFPLQEKLRIGNQFLTTQRTFNRFTGKPESEIGPHGTGGRTVYDDFGRPLEQYSQDTQGQERLEEKYQYDFVENQTIDGHEGFTLVQTSVWKPQINFEETNPANENSKPFQISWGDSSGNPLQQCTYSERGNYRRVLSRTKNGGRLEAQTEPVFTDNCDFVSQIAAGQRATQVEKDFQGRVVKQDFPDGDPSSPIQDVTYTYSTTADGYLQKISHWPNNQTRTEVFNDTERLIRLTDANGSTVRYEFNPAGDLETVIGNGIELVEMRYDQLGQKTQMTDADMGTWHYEYDNFSRLIRQTDNKGQKIEYEYTTLGRVARKIVRKANNQIEKTEVHTYDRGDNEHSVLLGEHYQVEEFDGQNHLLRRTQFGYEPLYRQNDKLTRFIPDVGTFQQTFEYDAQGRTTRTVYPTGEDIFYQYSRVGSLEKVCREITCKMSNHEVYYFIDSNDGYDVNGGLLKENFGNGVKADYAYYENSHRLRSKTIGMDQKTYSQRNYTYDALANIIQIQDPRNAQGTGGLQFARYDNLNRLVSYQSQGAPNPVNMVYDEKGNILSNPSSFGNDRYQYDGQRPHAVTRIGNRQFTYDDNGNMTDDSERAMVYNAENKLTRVAMRNGVAVNYDYDYTGARVSKTSRREDPLHQIHESTIHYLGEALEIKEHKILLHVYAGNKRILTKSLGNLRDFQGAAGAGLVSPVNYQPPFEWKQLMPYAMLFFVLFIIASFRPVRAPPVFAFRKSRPENCDSRAGSKGFLKTIGELQSTIYDLLATSNQRLATIWFSYTQSLHEALHRLHQQRAFKLISIALIFILFLELPLFSYAQVNPPRPQATDISDADYFVYHHGDHLGSTSIITEGKDESRHAGMVYKKGDLLQRFEYEPFGKEKFALNSNLSFDPRYTGQEYDIETGLYYYKARYYNPKLARFTQPDTIVPNAKDLQAFNKYSYVLNNPLKYTDPSGHGFWSWFKKLFVVFLIAAITVALTIITAGAIAPALAAAIPALTTAQAGFAAGLIGGMIGGIVGGAIGGAISGGLQGAFIGAALGLFGGAFFGPIKEFVGTGVLIAAGAGVSYATGGWEGLATFAAGLAGAYVGSKIGNSIAEGIVNARNEKMQSMKAEGGPNEKETQKMLKILQQNITEDGGNGYKSPSDLKTYPGADVEKNVAEARGLSPKDFYNKVKSGGPWDYKQYGKQYENFGNYHFGIVGKAAGWSDFSLKTGAGLYQIYRGNSSLEWYGSYFDDPTDQTWIQKGIDDYNTFFGQ